MATNSYKCTRHASMMEARKYEGRKDVNCFKRKLTTNHKKAGQRRYEYPIQKIDPRDPVLASWSPQSEQ